VGFVPETAHTRVVVGYVREAGDVVGGRGLRA